MRQEQASSRQRLSLVQWDAHAIVQDKRKEPFLQKREKSDVPLPVSTLKLILSRNQPIHY